MSHWTTLRGRPHSEGMSDLEWWFTRFVFLRNAIVHGDEIPPGQFRFGRQWQIWIAEGRLRDAIKETVARAGFPRIRIDRFDRNIYDALGEIWPD
jgi:hypothetical protein